MAEDFNPKTPNREGVRYLSYGALVDPPIWSAFRQSHWIVNKEEGDNDGLVSVESSKWGDYQGTLMNVSHLDLINWTNRLRWLVWELTGNKRKHAGKRRALTGEALTPKAPKWPDATGCLLTALGFSLRGRAFDPAEHSLNLGRRSIPDREERPYEFDNISKGASTTPFALRQATPASSQRSDREFASCYPPEPVEKKLVPTPTRRPDNQSDRSNLDDQGMKDKDSDYNDDPLRYPLLRKPTATVTAATDYSFLRRAGTRSRTEAGIDGTSSGNSYPLAVRHEDLSPLRLDIPVERRGPGSQARQR
ncbi:MAG: hypothetical protein Q9200_000617 [Gallowayella weberi]